MDVINLELDRFDDGGTYIRAVYMRDGWRISFSTILSHSAPNVSDDDMKLRFDTMVALMGDNVVPIITPAYKGTP